MSYPPSVYKTWIAGETLTAADLNSSFSVIPNSSIPEDIDDYSVNVSEMQTVVDPYPASSESLATSLSEELSRVRYQLKALTSLLANGSQWYHAFGSVVLAGSRGSAAAPEYSYSADPDTGVFSFTANQLNFSTAGTDRLAITTQIILKGDVLSNGDAAYSIGGAAGYVNDVSYKTLTDRGCLPWCDEGVELSSGEVVSDTEAILAIQKHPTEKTIHGLPKLDYASFPKKAYRMAEIDGKLLPRDSNDLPVGGADGVEMTMMFGIMLGAIKELTLRVKELEAEEGK